MDLITNPLFFIFLLIAAFFFYRNRRTIPDDDHGFVIGEAFEDYVQDVLFHDRHFVLIEKTHNHIENAHRYVESSLKPDFKFRSRYGGEAFHVEAKYRSKYYNEMQWCKPYQLDRYREIDKVTTVYIAIGISGSPGAPKYVYVIPLSQLSYNTFKPSSFGKYRCATGYSVHMNKLTAV